MSLLRDIQDAAVDPKIDVLFLLRKCKVLATRLRNQEFSQWIDWELNGYTDKEKLPDYRVIHVHSKGHFSGPAGSGLRNADIPLGCIEKQYREHLEKSLCMQPISAYIDLIKTSDGGSFQESWSPDLVAHVGAGIYQYMNCMSAWKVIPRPSIVSLVEAVRNRILNFVLEIETEAPEAGEAPPGKSPLSQEQVTQIFHTHIYGTVGNFAQGGQDFTQNANMSVKTNDFESLKNFLESVGFHQQQIQDLEEAVTEDSIEEVKSSRRLGPKVSNWLGSIMSGIAQGIIPIVQNVDANLITQAILIYYGIQ